MVPEKNNLSCLRQIRRGGKVVNHGCLPACPKSRPAAREQRRAQLACARAGLAPARGDGQGSAVAGTPWPTLGQAKRRKIEAIHCLEFTL